MMRPVMHWSRILVKFLVLMVACFGLASCASSSATENESASEIEATIPPYTPNGHEPAVAVLDFSNGSFFQSKTLGPGAASMVEATLVRSRRFKVVDRSDLDRIIAEQKLSETGLTSGAGAQKLGQLLNVKYMITGTVSEFGVRTEGTSFTGAATNASSFGGGMRVTSDKATARVVMDIKMIDVETGQIIYDTTVKGESSSTNTGTGILVITQSGSGYVGVKSGVQGFDETLAGKACRVAAVNFVKELAQTNPLK